MCIFRIFDWYVVCIKNTSKTKEFQVSSLHNHSYSISPNHLDIDFPYPWNCIDFCQNFHSLAKDGGICINNYTCFYLFDINSHWSKCWFEQPTISRKLICTTELYPSSLNLVIYTWISTTCCRSWIWGQNIKNAHKRNAHK